MTNKKKHIIRCACTVTAAVLLGWLLIPDYKGDLNNYHSVTKVYDSDGQPLRVVLGERDTLCEPIRIDEAGNWAVKALVAAEDKRFYSHNGIDPLAITRATLQNMGSGRIVSGASTISTLVIKMTEPRTRSIWTKIIEAHHAHKIESKLTKNEILEQFINRAPFGANIHGVESASKQYFAKDSDELSLAESALLMGLPQSPSRLRPDRFLKRAHERKDYVLRRMLECGFITEKQFENAQNQTITISDRNLPFQAPHFCDLILERYSAESNFHTTLDSNLQKIAEVALKTQMKEMSQYYITGGAIVIIDVKTGALLSMVGSPDFWQKSNCGQVNGATALRSPGSTLKPFIYAMAMDQGMCTPATYTADIPISFREYNPRNFNLNYCGPVSIRTALVKSLNIPALRYAQKVGLEDTVNQLRALGISTLDKPASHYGLSIAVGTCEITLLELANAYACLAREGNYMPTHFLQDEKPETETRLFSKEAAYMIADILSGDERAFDASGHIADAALPRVAWKTGTSSGFRDAWTIAYNPEYVVGVWIGNPNGRSSHGLIGSKAATPIAYEIFRRIYPNGNSPWYDKPAGLSTRTVCARSGREPGQHCPVTAEDYFVPELSESNRCKIHQGDHIGEKWPIEIERFLTTHGMAEEKRVIDDQPASRDFKKNIVSIVSPSPTETFHLLSDLSGIKQEVKLEARGNKEELFWFVDGELYCQSEADQSIFWPLTKGEHDIICSDSLGNCDKVNIIVK